MTVDKTRELLANKADELWNECLDSGYFLNYDIIKNYLERVIEDFFMISNMWNDGFVDDLSERHIIFLLDTVKVDELIIETKIAKKMEYADDWS